MVKLFEGVIFLFVGQCGKDELGDEECFDEVLFYEFDKCVVVFDLVCFKCGFVFVMYQMGSYGFVYFKCLLFDFKFFQFECKSNVLQQCLCEQVVNVYDNIIVMMDRLLVCFIVWLQMQQVFDVGMFYVFDYGELLGENGFYFYGMFYVMVFKEQIYVLMILWVFEGGGLVVLFKLGCLVGLCDWLVLYDNFFYIVMGWVGVWVDVYKVDWDLLVGCWCQFL